MEMQGNFYDEATGESVYISTAVDASIKDILVHRGVPLERVSALLVDLDVGCSLAGYEIDALLPSSPGHTTRIYEHRFSVLLGKGIIWTGDELRIERDISLDVAFATGSSLGLLGDVPNIPETVLSALPGKTLRQIFDHPYLPDRVILKAERLSNGYVIQVESDVRPVLDLAEASPQTIAGIPERKKRRRDWITGSNRDETCMEFGDRLDRHSQSGIKPFLAGEPQVFDKYCWGSEPQPPKYTKGISQILEWARNMFVPKTAPLAA